MQTACLLFAAILAVSCACAVRAADDEPPAIAPGPFAPTMESLKQYRCPEWFRDAKLGIWSHWGPQAVPMAGDWYARNMYIQGHRQYQHHLTHYGHPSEHGYKDIIPLWKAEKWDPDRLMELYKKAGARYFVSMGCHHDNFDLWNSRHNPWNAVRMGPRRDVVGDWQRAARKHGLKFGVSEHLGASFTWFQTSHGSDKEGPKAGVPYDGADPRYESLYHFAAEQGDTQWYSNNPRWHREWFERIRDLVDSYKPDLLYTDGGVPFGNEVGRAMIAHFYNSDRARVGSRPQVVYTCKQQSDGRWVDDLERGVMPGILPHPWQTDTSIGDWYYNADWQYRGIAWVIHMLLDIVSKNGNLLLNVVQRPDGSLDPEVERLLVQMSEWMSANGEGIYGTRPWIVFGEGAVRARGGHFAEDYAYTARDIRFTWKRGVLYAFALGLPTDGKLTIRTLSTDAGQGRIRNVTVLGHRGKVEWRQDADGLTVALPPEGLSHIAVGLKITGARLREFTPPEPPAPIAEAGTDGSFMLKVEDAVIHGSGLRTERRGDRDNLGFWDSASDWVEWKLNVTTPGQYEVRLPCATPHAGSAITVEVAGTKLDVLVPPSGSWDAYTEIAAGRFEVTKPGVCSLRIRPADAATWKAVNLRDVRVTRGGARGETAMDRTVRISDNGRYFVEAGGQPVFWMGTTQWQLFREYTIPEAETIIARSAEHGFVYLQVMLLGVGDGAQPNIEGQRGWTSADPLTPNEAYFRRVDQIVEIARKHGVAISMTIYHQRWRDLITVANARGWARWIAARYKAAPNIVWSMTPEAKPEFLPVLRELAAGIREGDGGGHLITFKPDPAPFSSSFAHDEPWLDFNSIQTWTSVELIRPMVTHDYQLRPVKPVVMAEGAYEAGTEYDFAVTPLWVRRQAYYSYLCGGHHTYGHNDSWRVLPTWRQALDAPGARQLGIMKKVLTSLPEWWRLVPDQSLLTDGGRTSGRILTLAARHADGLWAIVYCAEASPVTVRLDGVRQAGPLAVRWVDPRTGEATAVGNVPAAGARRFSPPAGWEDALLIIGPSA